MKTASEPLVCRFGPFLLDRRSGELLRNGLRVRLQEKPRSVLLALTERPGEIVSRVELQQRLWPQDTFVGFEDGLNTAMRKLREALGPESESSVYIETLRGRGYRFLATVKPVSIEEELPREVAVERTAASARLASATQADAESRKGRYWSWTAAAASVAVFCFGVYWVTHGHPVLSFDRHDPVLIADFDNQTGNPRMDGALNTAFVVSLEQSRYTAVFPRLQAGEVLRLMRRKPDDRITAAVGREICQRENIRGLIVPTITRTGEEYLITAQLIDPATGGSVRSYSEQVRGESGILSSLDSLSLDLRRDLGESQYQIHTSHQPLPQVTTASLDALENYSEGVAMWRKGDDDRALSLYRAALAADPNFAMAHAAMGFAYYSFHFNERTLGEQEFRKALSLSSRTTERERSIIAIRCAESQGRTEDTLQLQRAYLDRYPDDLSIRFGYARLLRMHGRPQEAVFLYQQILKLEPDNSGAYIEMATAYKQMGKFSLSLLAYEKAFSIDPSTLMAGNVNREYGFTLVRAGDDSKAEQIFTATSNDPQNHTSGERSLAFLDLYHGQYEKARNILLASLSESNTPFTLARIRYMLAVVAAGQGNRRDQLSQLDQIMADFDQLEQKVLYGSLVGQAYARAGAVEKARSVLSRIAPLANERVEEQVAYLQVLKAEIAAASGDFESATQLITPPGPNDSTSSAQVTSEALAYIYQKAGKPDEAIFWYRKILVEAPLGWEPQQQFFEAEYTLAQDLKAGGDTAGALQMISKFEDTWKEADPNLPLLKKAHLLHFQLAGKHSAQRGIPRP